MKDWKKKIKNYKNCFQSIKTCWESNRWLSDTANLICVIDISPGSTRYFVQQDEEAARLRAQKERDELAGEFDREKREFAKLIEQMREENENTNKGMEERGKLLRSREAEEEMKKKIQALEIQLRSKQSQLEVNHVNWNTVYRKLPRPRSIV